MNCFYLSNILKEIPGSLGYYSQSIPALIFEKTTYSNKNLTASDLAMLIHNQKDYLSINEFRLAKKTLKYLTRKIEIKKNESLWQKIKQIWLTSLDNSLKKRGFKDSLTVIQEVEQVIDVRIKAIALSQNQLTLISLPQEHLIDIINYLPHPFVLERVSKAFKQVMSIDLPQRFVAIAKQSKFSQVVQRALKWLPPQVTPKKQHQLICQAVIAKIIERPVERISTCFPKINEYLLHTNQLYQFIEWHQATQLIALFSRLAKNNQCAKNFYSQLKYSLEKSKNSILFEIETAKKIREFLKTTLLDLNFLDLSKLNLKDLPPEIGYFIQLKALDLRNNQLVELPNQISQLTQLKELCLASNQFRQFPIILTKFSQLQKLDLYQNRLRKLSKNVTQLTTLRMLYIHQNLISRLPSSIKNLSNLESFSFRNGFLKRLPNNLKKLPNLKESDLSHNELKQLLRMNEVKQVVVKPFLCPLKPA